MHDSFGQRYLTGNLKVARDGRGVAYRLSSAYRQAVFPFRDDDIAGIGNHTEIATPQVKLDTLTCTRQQVDPLEPTQRPDRCTRDIGNFQIKLRNFVAGEPA